MIGSAQIDVSRPLAQIRDDRAAFADLRSVWRQAGTIMRRSFAQNFREGGRPERWVPLAPSTVMAKHFVGLSAGFPYASRRGVKRIRRLEQNGQRQLSNILVAGGQLRDSYVQKNANHVSRVDHSGFEEGSKHWLAEIHENGTKPYVIRPKTPGGRLRFVSASGVRYAMSVRHPGLPARPVGIVQPEDEDAILALLEAHLG